MSFKSRAEHSPKNRETKRDEINIAVSQRYLKFRLATLSTSVRKKLAKFPLGRSRGEIKRKRDTEIEREKEREREREGKEKGKLVWSAVTVTGGVRGDK